MVIKTTHLSYGTNKSPEINIFFNFKTHWLRQQTQKILTWMDFQEMHSKKYCFLTGSDARVYLSCFCCDRWQFSTPDNTQWPLHELGHVPAHCDLIESGWVPGQVSMVTTEFKYMNGGEYTSVAAPAQKLGGLKWNARSDSEDLFVTKRPLVTVWWRIAWAADRCPVIGFE